MMHVGLNIVIEVGFLQANDIAVVSDQLFDKAPLPEAVPVEYFAWYIRGFQEFSTLFCQSIPLHNSELTTHINVATVYCLEGSVQDFGIIGQLCFNAKNGKVTKVILNYLC